MGKAFLTLTAFVLPLVSANGQATAQNTGAGYEEYFQTQTAKKARQDWMLNCQGCHKIDGTGRPERGLPNLSGEVAKFLSVEGGRAYLSRVPGVTNAVVDDEGLAELLNWLLIRFDPDHIPAEHKLYTVEEVRQWRRRPLSIGAATKRKALLAKLQKNEIENKGEKHGL